jgi:hypothetical protein
VGWLLLDAAAVALTKQRDLAPTDPDFDFYEGKKHAAIFFANQVLPGVVGSAKMLAAGDSSALDIPDAAFARV